MRILHLIDSGGLYGAEVMLLELMQAQRAAGLRPALISVGSPRDGEKGIERAARQRGLELVTLRAWPGPNPLLIARLLRLIRRERAEIVHSHGYKGNILLGAWGRGLRGAPLVSTLHGWTANGEVGKIALYEWADRLMLPCIEQVVTVSSAMREDPRLGRVKPARLRTIANGLGDSPPSLDQRERQRWEKFKQGRALIGAFGRLSSEKGFDLLLQALAAMPEERRPNLVLAGDGAERERLEQQARESGLGQAVTFLGYLPEAAAALGMLDLYLLPSRTEGLPMVILEAMRAGVPVVACDVGGVKEALGPEGGVVVPPGSPTALREAIERLLANPGERERLARAARERFVANYSATRMARAYLDCYRSVLAPGGAELPAA